jgi:hypothetical protein
MLEFLEGSREKRAFFLAKTLTDQRLPPGFVKRGQKLISNGHRVTNTQWHFPTDSGKGLKAGLFPAFSHKEAQKAQNQMGILCALRAFCGKADSANLVRRR